tara:strand:- start:1042 stop:1311 length:270 start_codon:yes stop_codon:yes gene_type:complete
MIGKEIFANYGAMIEPHYGMVTGVKTTTIQRTGESVKEVKVWWFEAGESTGETQWIPECTIRTEGGGETIEGSPIGFYWSPVPILERYL